MNTSIQQSSQLNDEQIEELVTTYSQYCELNSQAYFDPESQSLVVDSQFDETETEAPVKLDFQGEFLKCCGLNTTEMGEIATRVKSTYEPSTQHELCSQTDAETIIRAYMTTNPFWSGNIASKQLDIEAFLDNRDFFVTLKSGTNNEPIRPIAASYRNGSRDLRFTLGPLPLEIEDVLKIETSCPETQVWRGEQKIYGQKFKTVMFYGRCKPHGTAKSVPGRNVKIYEVDDGSGGIIVHFPHCDSKYLALSRGIDRLLEQYALAKKEGIAFLGSSHYGPKTEKCKQMLNNINILINIIKKNAIIKQEFFRHGSKVCVIGRVFWHRDGRNHVFAYDMFEDAGVSRDFEIKFKKHLLDVYRMKYLKFKVNGEPIDKI
ncbi:uncharacterized protein LOC116346291 [Contarinia nasturtii]|uniref:uncharacterized protein LOC116346291 n=1 Tax=Contarinia nasturtii TaxID=265458 RepID=UPI0012D4A147|nr:uncharacterized protein LOC116346291 [Contarinia nasturtii]